MERQATVNASWSKVRLTMVENEGEKGAGRGSRRREDDGKGSRVGERTTGRGPGGNEGEAADRSGEERKTGTGPGGGANSQAEGGAGLEGEPVRREQDGRGSRGERGGNSQADAG